MTGQIKFRVHIGYTRKGRDRYRKFATLAAAGDFCNLVFQQSGIVLSIESCNA